MGDLKHCPCCNGKAVLDELLFDGAYQFSITCTVCGLTTGFRDNRNDTIEMWNRRHYMEFGGYIVPDELGGFYELEKEGKQ